jgi:hypothetical protein
MKHTGQAIRDAAEKGGYRYRLTLPAPCSIIPTRESLRSITIARAASVRVGFTPRLQLDFAGITPSRNQLPLVIGLKVKRRQAAQGVRSSVAIIHPETFRADIEAVVRTPDELLVNLACGLRAFHKHKDFAVSYVIFCEKLRVSFRIDPYGGVWVARFDGLYGLTFVRNGDEGPFL